MLEALRSHDALRPLFDIQLAGTPLASWIALFAVAALAALIATVLMRAVLAVLARVHAGTEGLTRALPRIAGPGRLVIGTWLFVAGTHALDLSDSVEQGVDVLGMGLGVLGIAWLLTRLADYLAERTAAGLVARGSTTALAVVPVGQRFVKVLIVVVACIALLQNLGFDATSLVAGLGIGGLAFALAAQKTVENLFGGVTLIADQPVRVGDFCRFGDTVGTVEDVGLRSTRIRTLDRTVVTVPNAQFAATQLENFAWRDRFLLKTTIGLRYETTPDQLRHLLIAMKRLLVAHPRVHADPARARFVGFGACSLDVEIFAYILTADINEFYAIREDLLLRLMALVAESGTGFAFPSQTVYLAGDGGLDAQRAQAAAREVEQWRTDGALPLPNAADDMLQSLRGTLDYPPAGSVGTDARSQPRLP